MALNIKESETLPAENEIRASLEMILSPKEADRIAPLHLAWIGDSIFTDFVRKYFIITTKGNIGRLNRLSINLVKASSQAKLVHFLLPYLNEEEIELVRKGRNTSNQVPKSATVSEYRYATGFETLLGYLKLTGQDDRITELCAKGITYLIQDN